MTLRAIPPSRPRRRTRLLAGAAFAALVLAPVTASAQLTSGGAATFSAGGAAPVISQAGRTTDVTLNAARTILPWSSFRLTSDAAVVYRFQDRSGIVLNRISGQALIDGSVESVVGAQRGQGAVWFQAPGGVIFGPNARTNLGGLLATTGAVSEAGFLDSGNLNFAVTGAGAGRIEVQSGAQLTTTGGALVLVGGSISSGADSAITGAGASVLLGAASEFTVRFTSSAGDLDLVDFVVPNAAAGSGSATPFDLRGETIGANVFLSVVNRADVASAVINAPGLIAAQSATSDRGDVVLAAGVGIGSRQPGLTRINSTTATTADFGVVAAQRDLLGGLASPTTLSGQQFGAGRDLGVAATSVDVGALNAGRLLAVDAVRGISMRNGATSGAQVTLRTGGALVVGGGAGGLNALGQLQIDAGSVQAGQVNAGRSVTITASGVGAGGAAVNIASIVSDDDITVTTTNAAGHIVLGSASFTALRSDEAPAGHNLNLTARGALADITYGGPSGAALTGATRASLNAGRDLVANVSGPLVLNNSTAGRDLTAKATGALSITGGGAGRDLGATSTGALTVAGATVTGSLAVRSDGAVVLTGVKALGDLTATSGGSLSLTGGGAGRDLGATSTGPLTIAGATVTGSLTARSAGAVVLTGAKALGDLTATSGGSLLMTGGGGRDIVATSTAGLTLDGVTASGRLAATSGDTLKAVATKAGGDLTATASGLLTLSGGSAGRDLTVKSAAALTIADSTAGQDLSATAAGALTATGDAATRDLTLIAGGLLTVANDTAGRSALFRAGDLDITGAVKAAGLRVESLPGALTLGGGGPNGGAGSPLEDAAAPADAMRVTDAEFARITVTDTVSFYAGATGSTARGNLTVLDLHVTPARTPGLMLAAGPDSDVAITGALAPGVSGGAITVGDTTTGSGFLPGRILLSGSIGAPPSSTATGFIDAHALSETHLSASREIILGSSRFMGLIAGVPADQIDIAHDLPAGVAATPDEVGHVWIATGLLTMSAPGRILMQNTGTRAKPDGLFIDGMVPDPPPPGTPTLVISTTGVVDLFGTIRDSTGTMTAGVGAALTPSLMVGTGGGSAGGSGGGDAGGGSSGGGSSGGGGSGGSGGTGGSAPGPTIRFNGLDVSPSSTGGGSPASRVPQLIDPRVQLVAQGRDAAFISPSDAAVDGVPSAPPVISPAEPDSDVIALDPVPVSTGSYEIWHRKVKRK